ncbi:MAG TPA: electron transfer flavoprotein subunit alpha/FixB family protein [Perlabentimonas sp.]|jgi:electron transfer flavoprotein alpha subunit|nr:electron transfer flavoprotein subunit alpha/FixB family protein [Bacteroidales bacterium]MDD4672375.1 electron transfer flavoprotein subunit alpha/FixB family protein [Bacteroidales bacterium]MDY0347448.1 electron transfer flavoprotein subunit alpha/FixB family protein [Tenuifilaceae bacterium]HZJ73527.1 electron transfer flavoprotein subunit alpha/FixB family protein [Perlabentimonas sp.]
MEKSEHKGVFVFVEQRKGIIQNVSLELIGKARDLANPLNDKVYAILLGNKITDKAQTLIAHGADVVVCADTPELADYLTEPYTQAICHIANEYKPSILMLGATTIGRDLGPRVSARLGTGLTADCTKLEISEEKEFLMTRPAFGGNLMATIVCKEHRPQMSTVRTGVMQKLPADKSRKGEVIDIKIPFNRDKFRVKLLDSVKEKGEMVDISEAKILISCGRGMGNEEGIKIIEDLADTLDAQVSASRAVVDAGLFSQDRQVGQTGKTVRPNLYFAVGISGAIQHLAGMEESDFIVAINKDKGAPIFQVADLGIVGDARQIVKQLNERLKG